MTTIFDLRDEPDDWAVEINEDITVNFPDFFENNHRIGSPEWWESTEFDIANGKINHAGPLLDEGELIDVVSIETLDKDYNSASPYGGGMPEYVIERDDFWLHESVAVDKLVETESITIMPSGELDETSIYIETKVRVW
ncbi:hypothetical protein [Aliiglaciecola litoralis]|uniref:Uncharacterized protein n=1 Tax=Aliiglaciecola litoralis TaxID=582857 RepID=A0ABN1LUD4_9ALTE